jgi:hypothetical protein
VSRPAVLDQPEVEERDYTPFLARVDKVDALNERLSRFERRIASTEAQLSAGEPRLSRWRRRVANVWLRIRLALAWWLSARKQRRLLGRFETRARRDRGRFEDAIRALAQPHPGSPAPDLVQPETRLAEAEAELRAYESAVGEKRSEASSAIAHWDWRARTAVEHGRDDEARGALLRRDEWTRVRDRIDSIVAAQREALAAQRALLDAARKAST